MIDKFIEKMNDADTCIECVENVGYEDVEYNTFATHGIWKDGSGLKLSFNNGNTELYLDKWDQFNVFNDDEDGDLVYEFIFGNVKRKFIILPKIA